MQQLSIDSTGAKKTSLKVKEMREFLQKSSSCLLFESIIKYLQEIIDKKFKFEKHVDHLSFKILRAHSSFFDFRNQNLGL